MLSDNDTFVGVEIELENLGNFYHSVYHEALMNSGLWNVVSDGSLRNHGLEFIMSSAGSQPLKGGDIIDALGLFNTQMSQYIKNGSEPPECTHRTSIHVHVDVRDMSMSELKRLVLFYSIFEDTFFKWSLPERYHNNYCRAISLHHDVMERLSMLVAAQEGMTTVKAVQHGNKYDSINILSIKQRGSIEFRMMRGTYDTELILKWINMLLALRSAAKDSSIEIDLFPEVMSERGTDKLIDLIFDKWGVDLKVHATSMDLLKGIRVAQDILVAPRIRALDTGFSTHSAKTSSHLNAFKEAALQEIQ